jgi:hypothetical protein
MSPSLVGRRILSVRPLNVDDVKRDNEVVSVVNSANGKPSLAFIPDGPVYFKSLLLECADDSRFCPDLPDPILMTDTVVHDH